MCKNKKDIMLLKQKHRLKLGNISSDDWNYITSIETNYL